MWFLVVCVVNQFEKISEKISEKRERREKRKKLYGVVTPRTLARLRSFSRVDRTVPVSTTSCARMFGAEPPFTVPIEITKGKKGSDARLAIV